MNLPWGGSPLVKRIIAGVIALVVLGVGAFVAYEKFTPGPQSTATVYFSKTIGIYVDSQIRILGVPVGEVTKITPEGSRVKVDFKWSSRYKVPSNAGAAIVPPTIVSDRYIQLVPAYTGGPVMHSGAVIPESRTEIPVELDQIVSNLNSLSVALGPQGAGKTGSLNQLIEVSARNLSGNGQRLHNTLQAVSEALSTLSDNSGNLFATLDNLTKFTQTLDADNTGVVDVNNDLAEVATQLNGERGDLGAALHDLQVALGQVSSFVADNKTELTSDLSGLTSISKTIVGERTSLTEFLDDAPLALQNLALTYDPKYHTLDTRANEGLLRYALYCTLIDLAKNIAPTTCPLQDATSSSTLESELSALGDSQPHVATSAKGAKALEELLGRRRGRSLKVTRPGWRRWRHLAAIGVVVACATSACSSEGLYDVPLPGAAGTGGHSITVNAEFTDVLDLVPNSSVRINGVTVGSVKSISLVRKGQTYLAKVDMRVPVSDAKKLPYDTVADVTQTSLLGEKYVALSPDPNQKPYGTLTDGELIPDAGGDTSTDATVEQVFGALSALLNGGGVEQVQTIAQEVGQTLQGREGNVRDLLTQLSKLVGNLNSERGNIVEALDGLAKLSGELANQRAVLAASLTDLGPGIKVLADQRGEIVALLQSLAKLGRIGSRVIVASEQNTTADLDALRPILTSLSDSGPNLAHSFELALDYPFPSLATAAIPGDYTKLSIVVDLASFKNAQLPVVATTPSAPTTGTKAPTSTLPSGLGGTLTNTLQGLANTVKGTAQGLQNLLNGFLGGGTPGLAP